ncbi:hypothetical protein [Hymenobacter sp. 5516J-16]|uniref:hypothetical protein n=1 Tax=Hymenobacter sp. 5516J-16 TaxID=2932253 RepID=UPI00293E9EAA|nr:hypothetical protein [Hymenobacter sp. 5516J-16]
MLTHHGEPGVIGSRFNEVQHQNMHLFGYGAKSFMLSMIETVIQLTDGAVTGTEIQHILDHGKRLLSFPIELLPDVPEVLIALKRQGYPSCCSPKATCSTRKASWPAPASATYLTTSRL